MKASLLVILNVAVLITSVRVWAVTESTISVGTSSAVVPVEENNESRPSSLIFKPSAAITVGSTTNATLLTTPTAGAYGRVTPSISAEYTPSDSFFASSTVEGSLKRFSDPAVGPLANESRASAKVDLAWNLDDAWELGSNLSFNYLQNHIPVVGGITVEAIPQQYYQPDGRIYGAWIGDSWSLEGGAGGTTRRYDTTTFDLQGNTYRNTYNEIRADGKVGYRWSKDFKLQLKSSLERRSYQERMAEFSDGLPAFPGTIHPLLSILTQDNELQLKSRLSSVTFSPVIGIRFEKDLVYGARDSVQLKARGKVAIPLPWTLTLESEATLSRQAFSTFRADPINDPKNSPLRVDWEGRLGTALKLPLTRVIVAQAQYTVNRKLSNYASENYLEQVIETGMNMQF